MESVLGWRSVAGADGSPTTIDPASFGDLSTSRDTTVRRRASEAFYRKLKALEPALGLLLTRRLEVDHAIAAARHFSNGTDAFFTLADGLPEGAYRTMIDSARANRAVL